MKEYSLILNQVHMEPLLEALRLHQVSIENAPGSTDQEKGVIANLCRRAELLSSMVNAVDDLDAAEKAYNEFCEYGDAPTVAPVKVMSRPL